MKIQASLGTTVAGCANLASLQATREDGGASRSAGAAARVLLAGSRGQRRTRERGGSIRGMQGVVSTSSLLWAPRMSNAAGARRNRRGGTLNTSRRCLTIVDNFRIAPRAVNY